MNLADEYERQARWRDWEHALSQLPLTRGQRVLDVGCGIGTASARLAELGAQVLGVDVNADLLTRARSLHPALRFERADVSQLDARAFGTFDGIWCSFVAAYFSDLESFVRQLADCIAPGGWLALIEIDDLLGHEPRTPALAQQLDAFYEWASANTGYGFTTGRHLAAAVRGAGLRPMHLAQLSDRELSQHGPAAPEILEAWRQRLARMRGLQLFFGAQHVEVSAQILEALAAPEHRALCSVVYVIARAGSHAHP